MIRDMTNFNLESYCEDISNKLRFLPCNSENDPNSELTNLLNLIIETVNIHVPLRTLSRKQMKLKAKPWITKGLFESISTKNKLFNQCYEQKKTHLISKFKSCRNKRTKLKDIAKMTYYQNELYLHKNNISKPWKIMKLFAVNNLNRSLYLHSLIIIIIKSLTDIPYLIY